MNCPNRTDLLNYVSGKLPEGDADPVMIHLETCPNCQAELATLADPEDTFVAQFRRPAAADGFVEELECREAVARAKDVREGSSGRGRQATDGSRRSLPEQLGEYQVIERLGSGGMGTVYKALHQKLDRVVALKVLVGSRTDDMRAISRFEREIKAIGRLDHPHIVRAYDAREIEGQLVLAMEFVPGMDLGRIVRRLGRLTTADACEIARQTAVGLQAAHEHGLVHRDVKPSNLMLTPEGHVKVLDLGLARFHSEPAAEEEMTATGQAMGTADYMAPEQASDSRTADIRADIYSLGATLYKLLSGRAPFSGPEHQGTLEKMLAHRQLAVPPIGQLCPAAPGGLVVVLDRMLAKDPQSRHSTPAEAADALAPYCHGSDLRGLLQRAVDAPREGVAIPSPLPTNLRSVPGEGPGEGDYEKGEGGRRKAEGGTSPSPLPTNLRSVPGEGQGECSYEKEEKGLSASPLPQAEGTGGGWGFLIAVVAVMLLVGGGGFWMGVIIRIKQGGKQTTVEVPDGSTARINADGQVDVELPAKEKSATQSPGPSEPTNASNPASSQQRSRDASARSVAAIPAVAAAPAPLRYGFQAGREYPYVIRLHARTTGEELKREGELIYTVVTADERQCVLTTSGSAIGALGQQDPDSMPMFGPPVFRGSRPNGITLSRRGTMTQSPELTYLPFLLGRLELVALEEFPEKAETRWQRRQEIMIRGFESLRSQLVGPFDGALDGPFGGPPVIAAPLESPFDVPFGGPFGRHRPPFATSGHKAQETIQYAIAQTDGDVVRIDKKVSLSSAENQGAARVALTGSGQIGFDRNEGVVNTVSMKYEIQVTEANVTAKAPIELTCRLLTLAERAARKKRQADAAAAAEEAQRPKPITPAERAQLLDDLTAVALGRLEAAVDRLANSLRGDSPEEFSRALTPLLKHSNDGVKVAAAKALEVWATPQAESALIEASASRNYWVRCPAIRALGHVKTEKAAAAAAAQIERNLNEVATALRAMGPVAEETAISCLKESDLGRIKALCNVLSEIGGPKSLDALRKLAPKCTGFALSDIDHAIEAIGRRVKATPRGLDRRD